MNEQMDAKCKGQEGLQRTNRRAFIRIYVRDTNRMDFIIKSRKFSEKLLWNT